MPDREAIIAQMHRWYGIKYGILIGLFAGLLLCIFEPNLFGGLVTTLVITLLLSTIVFSAAGLLLYPLIKVGADDGEDGIDNQVILDYLEDRARFLGGLFDSDSSAGTPDSGGIDHD